MPCNPDAVVARARESQRAPWREPWQLPEQCIYCHVCSKGNCPAGITTSDDQVGRRLMQPKSAGLRTALAIAEPDPDAAEEERFIDACNGVKRYVLQLAEDLRRHLAALGLRYAGEMVGRVDGAALNPALGEAARLQLAAAALMAAGMLL